MDKIEVCNRYLNEIFNGMDISDCFFLENLPFLANMNDKFLELLDKYDFSSKGSSCNLTFMEVYSLARDVVSGISTKYLPLYDNLINTGILDFGYDGTYSDSYFRHVNNDVNLINIKREFGYSDVVTLVHEFFHYTNGRSKNSINCHILTEFLSIYFELFAIEHLSDIGVDVDKISVCDRLENTHLSSLNMYFYEIALVSFYNFGCLDYNMINSYFAKVSKDDFDDCVSYLISFFEDLENKQFSYSDKLYKYSEKFCTDYRYIFGTLLAFYAYEYCDLEKVIYLNDHINDVFSECSVFDALKYIGIEFDDSFLDDSFACIKDYINKFGISYVKK